MIGRDILFLLWTTFRQERGRLLLTISGVMVGAASLVTLSGAVAGGRSALLREAQLVQGGEVVEIRARAPVETQRPRVTRPLSIADATALERSPALPRARSSTEQRSVHMTYHGREGRRLNFTAIAPEALGRFGLALERGRFFSATEAARGHRVAVVGSTVWTDLLQSPNSLERLTLRTATTTFQVIGVLAKKPHFGSEGPWYWDEAVVVPPTVFNVTLRSEGEAAGQAERILVVPDMQEVVQSMDTIRHVISQTLLRRHRAVKNFQISGEEPDGQSSMILMIVSALLLGTGAVSLVVGGINIMNITLVSVSQRTAEIGLRRALGAPRTSVLLQFLLESCAIALVGGVLGVLGGILVTGFLSVLLSATIGAWDFAVVPWAPPLALLASLLAGAVFGLYPALRASRLDPVEALRDAP